MQSQNTVFLIDFMVKSWVQRIHIFWCKYFCLLKTSFWLRVLARRIFTFKYPILHLIILRLFWPTISFQGLVSFYWWHDISSLCLLVSVVCPWSSPTHHHIDSDSVMSIFHFSEKPLNVGRRLCANRSVSLPLVTQTDSPHLDLRAAHLFPLDADVGWLNHWSWSQGINYSTELVLLSLFRWKHWYPTPPK